MKPQQILDLEKYWGIEIAENDFRLDDKGRVIVLDLWNSQIADLSPLSNLRNLRRLFLNKNQIIDLKPLSQLVNLTELTMSNNQITDLQPLYNLSNLALLDLESNQIEDLKPLSELSNLTRLFLSDNQISDLKPLSALSNLARLFLSDNQISDLQPLSVLSNLTELYLFKNQIENLKPLSFLSNLKGVYLGNNQIKELNSIRELIERNANIYTTMNFGNGIFLEDNPLPKKLIQAIEQGKDAILAYLDNLEKEASKGLRPLNEAKMIVLGNVGAGKTSLVNYLIGKPFIETKSTQGISVEKWDIEDISTTLNNPISTTLNNQGKYRINVWDFGGDEIQQTPHRFFLTQNALYVVVLDGRFEENPRQYLEEIKSYAPNSPVIIVHNKIDSKPWEISQAALLSEYRNKSGEPMIKGFFGVSVLNAHKHLDPQYLPALRALDDAIVAQLLAMPTLKQMVPSNYFEVKSYLESSFFKDMPYITHDLYIQLCRDKNLNLASDEVLLGILNDLGTIRYLDSTYTRNLHILNPEWLSDGVYRILTAKHTHDLRGVISEKNFELILYKSENHVFEYPKHHYGYLIQMLEQFYLGYVNPESKKIFIPQAFSSNYPNHFNPDDYKTNAIHFYFQYKTFIPSGTISSFIARKFDQKQDDLYWKNGIVLSIEIAGERQTALVIQNDLQKRIDIWVQGKSRREFFIEIRLAFREFHAKFIALEETEMIGLDARRGTSVNYQVLIAFKHNRKKDYTDEKANDYNIDALLGNFEAPEDTKQFINQTFNSFYFKGDYNDLRGAKHIQFIKNEAQAISTELTALMAQNQAMSEENKALLDKLIIELAALQTADSPKEAKSALDQLNETRKNWVKIASEESVKWFAKKGLDQVPFKEKFDFIQEKFVNLLDKNTFQDLINPENWG